MLCWTIKFTVRVHINEEALIGVSEDNRIAGVELDAFCEEPIWLDNPILILDNMFVTLHVIGNFEDTLRGIALTDSCARNKNFTG